MAKSTSLMMSSGKHRQVLNGVVIFQIVIMPIFGTATIKFDNVFFIVIFESIILSDVILNQFRSDTPLKTNS